jgi:hypothetical protein
MKVSAICLMAVMGFSLVQCEKIDLSGKITILDENFRYALVKAGVDSNGNGKISYREAEAFTRRTRW